MRRLTIILIQDISKHGHVGIAVSINRSGNLSNWLQLCFVTLQDPVWMNTLETLDILPGVLRRQTQYRDCENSEDLATESKNITNLLVRLFEM